MSRRRREGEGPIHRLVDWSRRGVWQTELTGVPTFKRLWTKATRVVLISARGFVRDHCSRQAAALTYITIFALPPFLAFAFSITKGLGIYERLKAGQIDPFLDATFGTGQGGQVRQAIDQIFSYVDKTPLTSVAAIGLLVILYAVLKLLGSVEHTLNDIWGIQRSRPFVRKVTDYFAIVVVTPVLLVTGAGLTTFLNSEVASFVRTSVEARQPAAAVAPAEPGADGAVDSAPASAREDGADTSTGAAAGARDPDGSPLVGLASTLVIVLGMAFVIYTLPNTAVRLSSAFLGGLVAGLLWQLLQAGSVYVQLWLAGKNAIYSSLAAIPMLMMWIYISWTILLVGAEVACAHQTEPVVTSIHRTGKIDQRLIETLAPRLAARVARAFLRGEPAPTAPALASAVGLAPRAVGTVLERLTLAGLLARTGEDEEERYLPGRDPDTIRIEDLLRALREEEGVRVPAPKEELDARADEALAGLAEAREASPANVTLTDLATNEPPASPPGA